MCLPEVKFILNPVLPLCHFLGSLAILRLCESVIMSPLGFKRSLAHFDRQHAAVGEPLPQAFLPGLVLKLFIGLAPPGPSQSSQKSSHLSLSDVCYMTLPVPGLQLRCSCLSSTLHFSVTSVCPRITRITLVLRKLHWLPIQFHSEFKLATLVYKFIHTGFPKHFAPHLSHSALLAILDVISVLYVSSLYQNFNFKLTSLLSILASVLPLMLPLFGIHFLKTFTHYPLLPLLERSSKPISIQRHILLSSFSVCQQLYPTTQTL